MSDKKLAFEVITPEKIVVREAAIDFVIVQSEEKNEELGGELGIYPDHAPMLMRIPIGTIRYEKEKEVNLLVIASGFLEVKDSKVTVGSLVADKIEKFDKETAKAATDKAKEWLEEIAGKAAFDAKAAEAEVKRAIIGLQKSV